MIKPLARVMPAFSLLLGDSSDSVSEEKNLVPERFRRESTETATETAREGQCLSLLVSGHVNGIAIGSGHTGLSHGRGISYRAASFGCSDLVFFLSLAQLSIVQLSIGKQRKNGGRGLDKRPRQKGCNVGGDGGGTRSSLSAATAAI